MVNRKIRSISVVTLAASMFAGAVRAGEAAHGGPTPVPPAFEICRGTVHISGSSRPGLGGPLKLDVYFSDIMTRGPINDEDIRLAFEKFLAERYGQQYAGEVCRYAYTREAAQQIRDVEFMQGIEGQTIIETGWKYTPPGKPAPPPPSHFAVCWANRDPKVKYYSAVFDGSRGNAGNWWPAFQTYLKQKYGYGGPTQCIPGYAEADARKYLQTLIDQDKKTRTMAGVPPQIVETGWKY